MPALFKNMNNVFLIKLTFLSIKLSFTNIKFEISRAIMHGEQYFYYRKAKLFLITFIKEVSHNL